MRIAAGLVLIACGVISFAMFKIVFVDPAFQLRNELYGPVSFFRPFVYGISGLQLLIGMVILAAFR